MHSLVSRLEQNLGGKIESVGIMGRKDDRLSPLEAVFLVHSRGANGIERPWSYVLLLASVVIVTRDLAAIRAGIDDFRIMRVRSNVAALAAAHGIPIRAVYASTRAGAGNPDGAVVLLGAVHPIGKTIICDSVIELGRGLVALRCPACAAVGAHVGPAIVRFNHPIGSIGIDPQAGIVAVGHANWPESAPPIVGPVHSRIQDVDAISQTWIGKDVSVVKGALAVLAFAVHQRPGFSSIVGAEQAAFVGFDQGPDSVGIAIGHGHSYASNNTLRQPMAGEPLPRVAAIAGAVEAASRAAAIHAPWCPPGLPERGKNDVGVGRIECQIDSACVFIFVENFGPGLPAIGGAKDTPLRILTKRVAQCRYKSDVGVLRMDNQAADGHCIVKAGSAPRLSAVGGFIHAIAGNDVATNARFPGAGIDHVGV